MANDVFIVTADAAGKVQCSASLRDALTAIGLLPLSTELTLSANGRTITSSLKDGTGAVISTSSVTLPVAVTSASVPTQVAFDNGNLVLKNGAGTVLGTTPFVLPACQGV